MLCTAIHAAGGIPRQVGLVAIVIVAAATLKLSLTSVLVIIDSGFPNDLSIYLEIKLKFAAPFRYCLRV